VPRSPAEVTSANASPPSDFQAWFAGKEFSADWASGHFPTRSAVLFPLLNVVPKVLEIGSYKGYSALLFYFRCPPSCRPQAKTGVDAFLANGIGIYDEVHRGYQIAVSEL
jgi:hypothetical protein